MFRTTNARIANAASLSGVVACDGMLPCSIVLPAAWTAATLTFQGAAGTGASNDPGTFVNVHRFDTGAELEALGAAASRMVALDPALFAGLRWFRIRSGTGASPVNQDAVRDLVVVLRTAV